MSGGGLTGNSTYTLATTLANNATLLYKFHTFDSLQSLTLGASPDLSALVEIVLCLSPSSHGYITSTANNYSFSVDPAFLKFSLQLNFWTWRYKYTPILTTSLSVRSDN
jgi:hypothetical protein